MATIFDAKVRKLGNSLAVIVPEKIVRETGAKEGDVVKISILKSGSKNGKQTLLEYAGIYPNAKKFERDERSRI